MSAPETWAKALQGVKTVQWGRRNGVISGGYS